METITLKPRKEESILRHHPWVFSGAIASIPDSVEEGNLVKVVSADGKTLGYGHYQIGSIAVRLSRSATILSRTISSAPVLSLPVG